MIVFLAFRIRFAGLTKRKIFKFQKLVAELMWDSHYSELFNLLGRHLDRFFKVYRADFFWACIRTKLAPPLWQDVRFLWASEESVSSHSFRNRLNRLLRGCSRKVAVVLPTYQREQNAARESIRLIFLSEQSVEELSRIRPYLGIQVLQLWADKFERSDFFTIYMTTLLRNPQSIFYTELANTQNLSSFGRYHLSDSNRLLYYLFNNAKVAEELAAYKPVGDFVLKDLDRLALDSKTDPYNQPMGDFEEHAWRSPLVASIHFFEIMVMEALYQGIEWHMWLYYFPSIIKKIVHNYDSNHPLVDQWAEWPIRYSFLIYRMFSILRNWIQAIENIPPDQPNVTLKSTRADHENGNIPKSSILALGDCVSVILDAEVLGEKFHDYLLDIVFSLYFELKEKGFTDYAAVLRASLVHGGFYPSRSTSEYRSKLIRCFERLKREYFIKRDHTHVSELETELRAS